MSIYSTYKLWTDVLNTMHWPDSIISDIYMYLWFGRRPATTHCGLQGNITTMCGFRGHVSQLHQTSRQLATICIPLHHKNPYARAPAPSLSLSLSLPPTPPPSLTYLKRRGEKVFEEPKFDWISCVFEYAQHHYPAGCHGNE